MSSKSKAPSYPYASVGWGSLKSVATILAQPPRKQGMNTTEAFEAIVKGDVKAVFNLGGNLVRSVPDRLQAEPAWARLRLTINVATKLNRSHLVHGEVSYVLPCLSPFAPKQRTDPIGKPSRRIA